MNVQTQGSELYLTVAEVAERLKVNEETVRRLFLNEPGVVILCFPRKGRRTYRTLRIPDPVFRRVTYPVHDVDAGTLRPLSGAGGDGTLRQFARFVFSTTELDCGGARRRPSEMQTLGRTCQRC